MHISDNSSQVSRPNLMNRNKKIHLSNNKSDVSSIIDFLDDTNENIILNDKCNSIDQNNSLEGPGIIQSVYIPA